ncbi:MAG: SDR family oxidoreductase [Nitrosospira sp.]|nr:SDR family oxidoreductase [Nitrosospira sp.]
MEDAMVHTPEVVVITGANAGIGRAAARAFAQRGAHVALLARDEQRLEETRREVEQRGGKAIAIPTDVADAAQVEAAADRTEQELGPIDIWVNNAMTTILAPLDQISPADYKRVTDVTYHGFVWGTMAALKRMRPRNRGTVVQVSSALAYRSIPLQSPYCGAKHAIKGFTDSVRTELLHDKSKVHITSLEMPGINTPQFEWCKTTLSCHPKPMGRYFQPEVAARAIVWAAHARRREVHVGSPSMLTIIAAKLAPGLFDRYLALTGIKGQQTNEPIPDGRPANLWQPVPGSYEAHGSFDEEAHKHSIGLWFSMYRNCYLPAASGLATWPAGGKGSEAGD